MLDYEEILEQRRREVAAQMFRTTPTDDGVGAGLMAAAIGFAITWATWGSWWLLLGLVMLVGGMAMVIGGAASHRSAS